MPLHPPTFQVENEVGQTFIPTDIPNWALPSLPTTTTYATIRVTDNAIATGPMAQNTWTQVDSAFVAGPSQGAAAAPTPGAHVAPVAAANYRLSATLSFVSDQLAGVYEFALFIGGVVTTIKALATQDFAGGVQCVTLDRIIAVPAGALVDLRVQCTSHAGSSVVVSQAALVLVGV